MAAGGTTALQYEPPGPGSWDLDPVHFPRPVTRYWAEMHPRAVPPRRRTSSWRTTARCSRRWRRSTSTASRTARCVRRPTRRSRSGSRARRRCGRSKVWRDQLREWDETFKPAAIATHRELQAVDPDALSDDELVAYLDALSRPPLADDLPAHALHGRRRCCRSATCSRTSGTWTDVAPSDTLAMMRGAAPVSAGASGELERLIAAITQDTAARALLDVRRRSRQDARGAARVRRRRRPGDVGLPRPRRVPPPRRLRHLRALRARAARRARCARSDRRSTASGRRHGRRRRPHRRHPRAGARRAPRRVRRAARRGAAHVPDPRRTRRLQRHLGVGHHAPRRARRPAAGSRTRAASTTPSTSSTPASTRCARWCPARAGRRPTSSRSASRTARRAPPRRRRRRSGRRRTAAARPVGPPAGRRAGHAGDRDRDGRAVRQLGGGARGEPAPRPRARAAACTKGPARRVAGPTEFDRIVQGDVLVTESTTEAFNILLPLLGAIVTDSGGLLSHSAIVAREYGIPGVVGTRDATDRIPDGTRVRVDGDAGRSDGLRVNEVVPLAEAHDESRFGAKATGLGRRGARRAADPARHRARRARSSTRSPQATSDAIEQVLTAARAAATDRWPCGRRRPTRTAPTRASPASTSRCSTCRRSTTSARRSARSGGRRTPTRRSPTASASASSLARASASSCSRCSIPRSPGVMFTQNPINEADERLIEASWGLGEVVVAGRVIPDTFRIDPDGTVLERTPGREEDRDPRRGRRRHVSRRPSRRSSSSSCASTTTSSRSSTRSPAKCERGLRTGTRHRVGVRGRAALPAPVPRGHAGGIVTAAGRADRRADRSTVDRARAVLRQHEPARRRRHRGAVQGTPVRRGRDDHEGRRGRRRVLRDRVGRGDGLDRRPARARRSTAGDYFGEIALIDEGARSATITATSELVCHGLTYWEFRPLVQHNATIAWNLLQTLAKRLRTAQGDQPE